MKSIPEWVIECNEKNGFLNDFWFLDRNLVVRNITEFDEYGETPGETYWWRCNSKFDVLLEYTFIRKFIGVHRWADEYAAGIRDPVLRLMDFYLGRSGIICVRSSDKEYKARLIKKYNKRMKMDHIHWYE